MPARPIALAVTPDARLYVLDATGPRVQVLSLHHELEFEWGSHGTEPGQFREPSAIALDTEGAVYVADTGNHRIQKFSSEGEFLGQLGSPGGGVGQFRSPEGIAVDQEGNLFVADTGNHRIQKLTQGGELLAVWGGRGEGAGSFQFPHRVALGPTGNLYVTEGAVRGANGRIQKFTSAGAFLTEWLSPATWGPERFSMPEGLAVDAAEQVYVAEFGGAGAVLKLNADGGGARRWVGYDTAADAPHFLTGLAVTSAGEVCALDRAGARLQCWSAEGERLMSRSPADLGLPQGARLEVLGVSPPGALLVVSQGTLYTLATSGFEVGAVRIPVTGGEFWSPHLAVDASGGALLVSTGTSQVVRVQPDGGLQRVGEPGDEPGQFRSPWGVALDHAGAFYVTDRRLNRIQKFDAGGEVLATWGTRGSGLGEFREPGAIALDPAGRLWVHDAGNERLQVLEPDEGTWTALALPDGRDSAPTDMRGMAIGGDGTVYLTGRNARDRILKLKP